jgi:hypothetical protein
MAVQQPWQTMEFGQAVWLERLFRWGFAGVFLVNSAVAVLEPDSFIRLMRQSFLGLWVHDFDLMVRLIVVNDLLLGLFILSGLWARPVRAWAGLWLLAITLTKLSTLVR